MIESKTTKCPKCGDLALEYIEEVFNHWEFEITDDGHLNLVEEIDTVFGQGSIVCWNCSEEYTVDELKKRLCTD